VAGEHLILRQHATMSRAAALVVDDENVGQDVVLIPTECRFRYCYDIYWRSHRMCRLTVTRKEGIEWKRDESQLACVNLAGLRLRAGVSSRQSIRPRARRALMRRGAARGANSAPAPRSGVGARWLTPKVLWTRRRDAYYDYGTETVGDIIGKSAGGSCCCDLVLAARSSDLVDGSAASAD
jgi:hypothetical protein